MAVEPLTPERRRALTRQHLLEAAAVTFARRGFHSASLDEVGLLGVEAPADSVQVLKDSLGAAQEQVETARKKIREVRAQLKIQ